MAQRKPPPQFDPQGPGYFEEVANKMRSLWPASERPTQAGRVGEERNPNNAWDTWVFEAPEGGVGPPWWYPHGGSVLDLSPTTQNMDLLEDPALRHNVELMQTVYGPDLGLALKGRGYPTWDKFVEAETQRGKDVVRSPSGHYFSIRRKPLP